MSVIPFCRKPVKLLPPKAPVDPSLDRLVTLIHDVNIAALDKLLGMCQRKVNFSVAADQATRLGKQVRGHCKTLSLLPGVRP